MPGGGGGAGDIRMTWVLIGIGGWLALAALVGLFAWGLARAAAIGDRDQVERTEFKRALEADTLALDPRVGPADRRRARRPWAVKASGRRTEDALRHELVETRRALRDLEARLAELETRRSA